MSTIGERIRSFAVFKYGKINDFAEALGMGAPNAQAYMRGARKPGRAILTKLQEMGCNLTWLLTGEGEMCEADEKKSYSNAHQRAEKGRSSGVVSESDALYQYPPGPWTKALGKAMCIEKIQEGDDILIDIGVEPKAGDLVLVLRNDIPTIERYVQGDPKPYAICNRLMRNLKQPAKPRTEL